MGRGCFLSPFSGSNLKTTISKTMVPVIINQWLRRIALPKLLVDRNEEKPHNGAFKSFLGIVLLAGCFALSESCGAFTRMPPASNPASVSPDLNKLRSITAGWVGAGTEGFRPAPGTPDPGDFPFHCALPRLRKALRCSYFYSDFHIVALQISAEART